MEPDLAPLGKLWPNREHESNWLKGLICAVGFHRWHTLKVGNTTFDFCRWCPEIRSSEAEAEQKVALISVGSE